VRDVAIVSFAQTVEARSDLDEVEMLAPTIGRALATAKITKKDVDVTVSASCDYLGGRPFSFVTALDAVGAWPPIRESHVEMDGAWAVYEAWVALQHGDIDVAMVYAFGRSTQGRLHDVLSAQLDPYLVAPLGVDAISRPRRQASRRSASTSPKSKRRTRTRRCWSPKRSASMLPFRSIRRVDRS
jgi:acetyl-CoA acetyltransferase